MSAFREDIEELLDEVVREINEDRMRLQQEINYLRMPPCQLQNCVEEKKRIREDAVRDAIIEKFEGDHSVVAQLEKDAYAKGKLAGLEMAAEIAEKATLIPGEVIYCNDIRNVTWEEIARHCAKRIRAKAKALEYQK